MPTLDDIVRHQTSLDRPDVQWLRRLVTDWQIVADLSFADLVLWVADAESKGYWAVAQIRPTTGPTALIDDVAGTFLPSGRAAPLEAAARGGRNVDEDAHDLASVESTRIETVPVRHDGRVVAVLERRSSRAGLRVPSRLEEAYLDAASLLLEMVSTGEFPVAGGRSEVAETLRVGDGFLRTDAAGAVTYASPNAQSAYRRMGLATDLVGTDLREVTRSITGRRPTDDAPVDMLAARLAAEGELETSSGSLMLRVLPLHLHGQRQGAVVLLRDVTELRLRERELVSKEATIREIHHRVKNNLQTVAALLRLQGRRMDIPEARHALEEAERRVGSIALVHETLSHSTDQLVEFDEIADRLLRSVLEVAGGAAGGQVTATRIGDFGALPGEIATPLAMVLTELVQNAVEHGFPGEADGPGTITLTANRIRDRLRMRVSDDGAGLPDDFDPMGSLGLSIVQTLVESELGGTLTYERRSGGGTTVAIHVSV